MSKTSARFLQRMADRGTSKGSKKSHRSGNTNIPMATSPSKKMRKVPVAPLRRVRSLERPNEAGLTSAQAKLLKFYLELGYPDEVARAHVLGQDQPEASLEPSAGLQQEGEPKRTTRRGKALVLERGRASGVYVLRMPGYPNFFKVGCAADISERSQALQTAWPEPIKLVEWFPVSGNAEKAEQQLHRLLAQYHVELGGGTEFFECSIDKVRDAAAKLVVEPADELSHSNRVLPIKS